MVRLFWRFVGAPIDRPGGPWWCRDFYTEGEACSHHGIYQKGIIAEVRLYRGKLPPVSTMNIWPPDDAVVIWDGDRRVHGQDTR